MGSPYQEDGGRWGDGQAVEVRYPLADPVLPEGIAQDERLALLKADRAAWPWLTGEIAAQCGPDEWQVTVYDRRLAVLDDGSPAAEDTPAADVWFPGCYRDGSEIREPQREAEAPAPGDSRLVVGQTEAEYIRAAAEQAAAGWSTAVQGRSGDYHETRRGGLPGAVRPEAVDYSWDVAAERQAIRRGTQREAGQ